MLTVKDGSKVDWGAMSLAELALGNSLDTYFTLKIFNKLEAQLRENPKLYKLYESMICPLISLCAEKEYEGLNVSTKRMEAVGRILKEKCIEAEDKIYSCKKVKNTLSVTSPDQLRDLMFLDEEGYKLYPPIYTPKGDPSTDKETFDILLLQIEEELSKREDVTKT